jgi:hypothetical protein
MCAGERSSSTRLFRHSLWQGNSIANSSRRNRLCLFAPGTPAVTQRRINLESGDQMSPRCCRIWKKHKTASDSSTRSHRVRWHAVSIVTTPASCHTARALRRVRFLSNEAPHTVDGLQRRCVLSLCVQALFRFGLFAFLITAAPGVELERSATFCAPTN